MKRLTIERDDIYFPNKSESAYTDIIRKLGKLEDIEEKTGIPLDVLFCEKANAIEKAVKKFAEELKKIIHERDYVQGYAEIGLIEEIDQLLKENDYGR